MIQIVTVLCLWTSRYCHVCTNKLTQGKVRKAKYMQQLVVGFIISVQYSTLQVHTKLKLYDAIKNTLCTFHW